MQSIARQLPTGPGVYLFRDVQGQAIYVGRAVNLRRRVASYWSDLRDRQHLKHMVEAIAAIEAVECASEHESSWLERNVLEQSLPSGNRSAGGQETETWVAIDPSPRTPRVTSTPRREHDNRLYFGPYLGGQRVRTALSGIHRVHPLAYSGSHLTASERDLATILGVAPQHRAALQSQVVAVLNREPSAISCVIDGLVERRDQATEKAAFERAKRLQNELVAVEWLVSPQRVTTPSLDDFDFHGWHEGVLVTFRVRRGRLIGWDYAECEATPGLTLAAKTPASWQHFARDNAMLAATLRGADG